MTTTLVSEALRRHASRCAQLDYMTAMLEEESNGLFTASEIENLLGSFFADAGYDSAEIAAAVARDLAKDDSIAQHSNDTERGLTETFRAGRLLDVKEESPGYIDPYLGLKKVTVNFNHDLPIDEAMKLHAAQAKAREQQLRAMRDWERQRQPLPPPRKFHGEHQREKVTDIQVHSFSVLVAGRELLKDSKLQINIGRRYGLIGRNGIGKSTFISALVRKEIPGIPKDITIGCVEQDLPEECLERTPIQCLLDTDVERSKLLAKEAQLLESDSPGDELAKLYERMAEIDAAGAPAEASAILAGLQFSEEMQHKPVKHLSGGWRVRVALGRALFATPDILCLDEPTNHLDLHAVAWLTEYLCPTSSVFAQRKVTTCIIVSHSRSFLNDVCTDIIDFRDQKLVYYKGDFDTYERVRDEALKLQQRKFDAQQAKREHIQKFIDRFRAKAARAALVQSRIKALEKLPMLDAVSEDPTLTFTFKSPEQLPLPILQVNGAYFSYKIDSDKVLPKNSDDWILKDVDLRIDLNSRIAICGVNGSGKTTLLKLLKGDGEPQRGRVVRHPRLRVGFFSQHFVESMDMTLNAVQMLQERYNNDNISDEAARTYLGGFGISGLLALEPLYILSGGQKSRVAIALMAWNNPHVLILDEPTNHLDLDAIQALIAALNNFEGGLVVVSHDVHLLSCVADDVYYVSQSKHALIKFDGDILEYKKALLQHQVPT